MERVAVMFSGGKDSCLALRKTLAQGKKVLFLLSLLPENEDSWMFHKPDINLLKRQAEELGIQLIIEKTRGEKEKGREDLEKLIENVKAKVDGIVAGGIKSNYQAKRIKLICEKFNLKFTAPLWNYSSEEIWNELLKEKFQVILTKISCEGIGKEWIGKIIKKEEFKKLQTLSKRYKFQMDFEGGEAETAVLFMPKFKKNIKIDFDIKSEGEYRHFIKIKRVH